MRLLLEAGRETLSLDGRGAWPSAGGAFVCTGETKKQRFFRNTESLQAEPAFNKRCSRRRECSRSCWRAASLSSSSYRPTYTTRTPVQPSLCCGMQAKVPVNWAQASHLWSELQLVSWLGRAAARGEPRRRALAPARFGWVAAAGAGLRETAGLRLSCKRHRAEDIPLRAWKGHLADGRLTLRCRDTNSTPAAEDQNTRTKPRRDGAGGGRGAQARAARRCDSACADCHCCLCHRAASSSCMT